jgi:large subunit ribosomal protein L21
MPYAVIRTGGKQYRVAPGDLVRVERLPGDVGAEIRFEEVLLASDEAGVRVGRPTLEGTAVTATVVSHARDRKVLVYKKKRRKNYRRRRGHRQTVTTVRVTAIG